MVDGIIEQLLEVAPKEHLKAYPRSRARRICTVPVLDSDIKGREIEDSLKNNPNFVKYIVEQQCRVFVCLRYVLCLPGDA